jgi:hypothetical protein
MIKRRSGFVLEITALHPDTIENDLLNAAVEIVREQALTECRHGILVTQHGYTNYTVAVSPEVPLRGDTRTAPITGELVGGDGSEPL